MSAPPDELVARLLAVELPTLGHFIEDGFCDSRIAPVGDVRQMVGVARTLDLREPDALAVNAALCSLRSGDVLVIRVEGGRHAAVGAVTIAAAISRGAAGVVVDGPVTDVRALQAAAHRLPVFATGLTSRTTKRLGTLHNMFDVDIVVGSVEVRPGDLVLGDAHGVLVQPSTGPVHGVLDAALASDRAEPDLLARIASGEPLETLLATIPDQS